jgi:hypothetical protein
VSEPPSWSPPSGWAPEQPPPSYPPANQPGGPQATGWQQQPGWGAGPTAFPPAPPPPPKPGIIALRPLGVGEILDGAISALRTYPRITLGLSAVVAVITQVITVPVTWLLLHNAADSTFSFDQPTTGNGNTPGQDVAFAASSLTAAVVQILVALVASLVLTGILTVVVSRAVLGQQISTRAAWDQARPRIPALLGVTVLVLLIIVGIAVLALAPGVLLAVASAPAAVVAIAFVLGGLVLAGLAVYLYTAFALAPPAIVLERQPVVASLRRSRELVRGAWWRTFGILVLVNVIAQVINNILNIPFLVITMVVAYFAGDGSGLNIYEIVPLLITSVGTIVASAVTWPFTAVSTALLYVDRRMRREALDLELARAAGVAPSGQPTLHQ